MGHKNNYWGTFDDQKCGTETNGVCWVRLCISFSVGVLEAFSPHLYPGALCVIIRPRSKHVPSLKIRQLFVLCGIIPSSCSWIVIFAAGRSFSFARKCNQQTTTNKSSEMPLTPSSRLAGAVLEPVRSWMRNSVQSLYFSLMALKRRKKKEKQNQGWKTCRKESALFYNIRVRCGSLFGKNW